MRPARDENPISQVGLAGNARQISSQRRQSGKLLWRGRLGRLENRGLSGAHRAQERQARSRTDRNAVPMPGNGKAGAARQCAAKSTSGARANKRDFPWLMEEPSSFRGMRGLFTVNSADAGWLDRVEYIGFGGIVNDRLGLECHGRNLACYQRHSQKRKGSWLQANSL